MISVKDAIAIILQSIQPLEIEQVSMIEAISRILAEDITSALDSPLWDNSAMDGFAIIGEDAVSADNDNPAELKVTESIPAGSFAKGKVIKGESHQIMTGAPMPAGADTVVKKEDTFFDGKNVSILAPYKTGANVRYQGENFKENDVVLLKGKIVTPGEIAMAATIGRAFLSVYKRPTVAILSTGDELAKPGGDAGKKIYDSNSYTLASQVFATGGIPHLLGIAQDTLEEICEKVTLGLKFDMLLVSGGVSVGSYDYVKEAFSQVGVELDFWKVKMRPGNPLAFGTANGKAVFGLPGNPVSAMVTFEQFVRPVILKMMGSSILQRAHHNAVLDEDIKYKQGMTYFLRGVARLENGTLHCVTTGNQGSGNTTSLVDANCIIVKPENDELISAGSVVKIQLLKDIA